MAELYPNDISDKFQVSSFNYGIEQNFIQTDIDTGPAKRRRRTTKRTDKFSGAIWFTKTELDTFFLWYENTIKDGTLTFLFNDPLNSGNDIEVRFVSSPSFSLVGYETYSVSFELEKA